MVVAQRIRIKREELKLKQHELAKMIDVSNGQMSRYENDENIPSAEVVIRLANVLHTTPNWLLGFDNVEDEELSKEELEILRLFRSKPPKRYNDILEIMRRV